MPTGATTYRICLVACSVAIGLMLIGQYSWNCDEQIHYLLHHYARIAVCVLVLNLCSIINV